MAWVWICIGFLKELNVLPYSPHIATVHLLHGSKMTMLPKDLQHTNGRELMVWEYRGILPFAYYEHKRADIKAALAGGKQILRLVFECHLLIPRLPYVNNLRLSASLKAWYGNQAVEELWGYGTWCRQEIKQGWARASVCCWVWKGSLWRPLQLGSKIVPLQEKHL